MVIGIYVIAMQSARKIEERNSIIQTLPNGTVLVDYGPMRMFIYVYEDGKPLARLAKEGADLAIGLLEDLSRYLPLIKMRSRDIQSRGRFPEVVRIMIEATRSMDAPDLTPLAAVAGTTAEMVADFIFSKGGTKVIVDNGGDIAIRLRKGEVARVGIKTEISAKRPAYLIEIDSAMGIGGVATSGLGGRSFTKGIASAVTVLAENASLADAAATVVANFTDVEDSCIERKLAQKIYPDTDIAGQRVTTNVGKLIPEKVEQALGKGLSTSMILLQKGLIRGAFIALQGRTGWTDSLNGLLKSL